MAADRGEGVIVGMDMVDGGLKGGEVMVDLVEAEATTGKGGGEGARPLP